MSTITDGGIKRNKCTKRRNLITHRKWTREVCRCNFLRFAEKSGIQLGIEPRTFQIVACPYHWATGCIEDDWIYVWLSSTGFSCRSLIALPVISFCMDVVVGLRRLTTQAHAVPELMFLLSNTLASTVILFLDALSPTTQHASTFISVTNAQNIMVICWMYEVGVNMYLWKKSGEKSGI